MGKKAFIAAIAISTVLISLFGTQAVQVTKANPFLIYHEVNPPPGTIPPKITIYSPQNNTVYSSDKINISFYVYYIVIIFVNYTLDNHTVEAFSMWRNGSASSGWEIPEFNTTFVSPSLPAGNHRLTVAAKAVVYGANRSIFFIDGSSTTFFSTSAQPSQQNLSSNPSPTQQPTILPSQTPDRPQAKDFAPILIPVSMILLAIIAVDLLFHFSKHRGKKQ